MLSVVQLLALRFGASGVRVHGGCLGPPGPPASHRSPRNLHRCPHISLVGLLKQSGAIILAQPRSMQAKPGTVPREQNPKP